MSGGPSVLRSIVAVIVGIVVSIVLSLGTDFVMHKLGYFPPLGQPAGSGPLLVATVYRSIYGVFSSYVCARLAAARPMFHAMVLGFLGFIVSIIGAVATWSRVDVFGPRWYPLALVILVLPTAWIGGKIREKQLQG